VKYLGGGCALVSGRRSGGGRRLGGRGSSRRRRGAWGTDGVFEEGPEWRSMVARQRQARWRSCIEAAEEEKGSLHRGGGAPFIAGGGSWQRRRELRAERWWQRSHGHGKAVVAAVQTWSAPLFGQGG
jgi:hypothetical protein